MGFTASGDGEQDSLIMLPLPGYQEDEVWLEAYYSHSTTENTPIVLPIK